MRRLLLGAGLLALLGVTGTLLPLMLPRRGAGIAQANYERLREGMTLDEVQAILGDPAGDYTGGQCEPLSRPLISISQSKNIRVIPRPVTRRQWISDQGCICVGFTQGGQICRKAFLPVERQYTTFLDRLRRVLPW
jgi:hypothetical protein